MELSHEYSKHYVCMTYLYVQYFDTYTSWHITSRCDLFFALKRALAEKNVMCAKMLSNLVKGFGKV